jgi:hypothetical protein
MGLLDLLPKNPKIDDVVHLLAELDGRVINLEQYVARNEARIKALEARYDAVVIAAGTRIANLEANVTRERRKTHQLEWLTKRGRRGQP